MTRFAMFAAVWAGCGGLGTGDGAAPSGEAACDLSVQSLAGKTFVMYEAMPDKSYVNNPLARLQFAEEEGGLKAKYTVKSLSDVYTYDCSLTGEGEEAEVRCLDEERLVHWCQALLAADPTGCTTKKLKELGATAPDEELKEAIREAKKVVKEARADERSWKRFVLENNNLGNKLQGRLFAKKSSIDCQLSVEDMYFTIYNGKSVEDFNPVGKNPFVETDEPYVFEHCNDGLNLAPYSEPEPPKDVAGFGERGAPQPANTDIWYHYIGKELVKAEEGCSYAYDAYSQYLPQEQNVAVQADEKGRLRWIAKTQYAADKLVMLSPNKGAGVFHMARYKQCGGGEREKVDVVCSASLVEAP